MVAGHFFFPIVFPLIDAKTINGLLIYELVDVSNQVGKQLWGGALENI